MKNTPGGYVVRGKWRDPETGLVYLADNDGRLESPGWHVTCFRQDRSFMDGTQNFQAWHCKFSCSARHAA